MNREKYDNFYHHNRNYGCRYKEMIYKGFKTVVLENEKIQVTILAEKGTDIIEFVYKPMDIDFMWKSPLNLDGSNKNPLTKDHPTGAFLDIYEGGWQEMFPSINLPASYKGSELGFHGEVMYLPWDYQVITDDPYEVKIKFSVRCNRTPFFVEKTITLKSGSTVLEFEEKIINEGDEEFRFTWGHHPAFGKPFLDEDCVIDMPPEAVGLTYEEDFSGNSIIAQDEEFEWPNIKDNKGNDIDLSKIMSPDKKTAFNVYIKDLKEGWYGITNLRSGVGFGMKWDINVFKYILLWYVYRGFYNFPFYGRTYSVAIEPWSAIPGSLDEVIRLKRESIIGPLQEITTRYQAIVYESKSRIKGFTEDNEAVK